MTSSWSIEKWAGVMQGIRIGEVERKLSTSKFFIYDRSFDPKLCRLVATSAAFAASDCAERSIGSGSRAGQCDPFSARCIAA
jgi:hypothetical protein